MQVLSDALDVTRHARRKPDLNESSDAAIPNIERFSSLPAGSSFGRAHLERDGGRHQHGHDRTRIASLSLDLSCAIRNIPAKQPCDIVWIHGRVIDRVTDVPKECANPVVGHNCVCSREPSERSKADALATCCQQPAKAEERADSCAAPSDTHPN